MCVFRQTFVGCTIETLDVVANRPKPSHICQVVCKCAKDKT